MMKILGYIIVFCAIGMFWFGIYEGIQYKENKYETKVVDCYDEYGNKIIGLQCVEKTNDLANIVFYGFMGFILLAIGVPMIQYPL